MYSVFIPILLGIIQLKRTKNFLISLFVLVSFSCISDFVTWYNHNWREFMWIMYEIVEFTTLILIFISVIDVKAIKLLLIGLLTSFFIYSFIYHTYLIHIDSVYPDLRLISSFVFILIPLYYFYYIHTNTPTLNLFSFPSFWITTAVLIYFAGNFFLFMAIYFFTMEKVYLLYYPIHNVLNATKNILFGVAFFTQFYTSKRAKLT